MTPDSMSGWIRRKPVMGAVAVEEAEPHPFDDAMKRVACERREASFPETPPETPSPETPSSETPQTQLGDFSRIYDFLSTTPVTPKSPCHNRDTFPVVSDGLTGRPPDVTKETPTASLKVAGRRRMSQSTTTKSNVITSEFSSETTVKAVVIKSTPSEKSPGFADLPKLPEFPVQPFPHPFDHLSAAVARLQLKALKPQLLEAKLLREMDIDQTIQTKRFDGKRMAHIFIDMSNIFIGFNNAYKAAMGIPKYTRIPFVPLDFGALQKILERGRAIGAREVVGSAADPENISDLPQYFHDAKSLAYNTSVLRRVLKPKRVSQRA
ncbi:hypothetical protein IMZ48_09415, partial [Candidatus Bathyarchaeota archaeon]|nr:hypothetical protein [Candidatus Bathyarchaeota archaeon]